jgi:uncharacterized protein (TIGR02597 family)
MNKLPLLPMLLAGAFLASISSVSGSTVTTTPVGYITKTVNANADLRLGLPFKQSSSFSGAAASVSSGTINVTGSMPDVTTAAHYAWITSGTLEGNWYVVSSSDASSVTVAEDLESAGLSADDTLEVIPFWTLNTLFPDGNGFTASSDPFGPIAFILTSDISGQGTNLAPATAYFYHDGSLGPAGWYINGDLGSGTQDNTALSPEAYITIRNGTSSAITATVAGTVPSAVVSNDVVQRAAGDQDNQIPNPYPSGVTLANSGLADGASPALTPSPDPFSPVDLLLVFDAQPTATNPAPDKAFFYHDGSLGPAGWYINGDLGAGTQDTYTIPAGAAIVVRKASGADSISSWSPALPYSL